MPKLSTYVCSCVFDAHRAADEKQKIQEIYAVVHAILFVTASHMSNDIR